MSATMEGNLRMFMEYFGGDTPVKHISSQSLCGFMNDSF